MLLEIKKVEKDLEKIEEAVQDPKEKNVLIAKKRVEMDKLIQKDHFYTFTLRNKIDQWKRRRTMEDSTEGSTSKDKQ